MTVDAIGFEQPLRCEVKRQSEMTDTCTQTVRGEVQDHFCVYIQSAHPHPSVDGLGFR